MIPYIAGLVVLIVSVLFAVYKRVDPFEVGPFRITNKTTVEAALKKAIEVQTQQDKLLKLIEKVPSDDIITDDIIQEFKFPTNLKGKLLQETLKEGVTSQSNMVKSSMQDVRSRMRSGEISKTMPVIEAAAILAPQVKDVDLESLNTSLTYQLEMMNAIERFLTSTKKSAPKKKEKEKEKKNSMRDIFGGVRQAIKASSLDTTDAAPEASTLSTQEMEDRIANRVAKQVKNSMLSQRSTEEVYGGMPCPFAPVTTDAVAQGQEFSQTKPTSAPDMSQYIRKDSIPCWNCSLP